MLSIKPGKIQRGISLLEVLISLLILSLGALGFAGLQLKGLKTTEEDRKSTRLNSSHVRISYAVFCLKKKIISQIGTTLHVSLITFHFFSGPVLETGHSASKRPYDGMIDVTLVTDVTSNVTLALTLP